MTMTPTPAAPSLAFGEDTGTSDADGVINLSGPLLIGQTLPNATITLYDNAVAAGAANTLADANGYYAIYPYPVLDDGKHTLTITATAPGDAPSLYSPPLYLVVDTSPPDPPTAPVLAAGFDTGPSAEDGITDKNTLRLAGATEPNAMVALFNGSSDTPIAQAMAGADGSYTLNTSTLADGVYSFTVKALDLAGNLSKPSAPTSITVDTTAPAAPAAPTLSPGTDTGASHADGLTSNDTPVVVGTAEANATVELFDGATMVGKATADGTGAYAITSDKLEEGAHALTVKAVDAAGNVGAASAALNAVIDTTAATGTSTPATVDLGAGSVTFTVQFSELVTGVTAADFTLVTTNTVSGSVQSVTGSGSTYTVTVSGLDGQGTVGLALADGSVTDLAGNAATLKESNLHAVSGTTQPSTIEVSTDTSGLLGSGQNPSPSASGRLVAFTTQDGAVTTGPATNGLANIVVRDTVLGKTALVSYDLDGAAANGASGYASMSADGTEIAFASQATNLVDTPTEAGETNIYLAKLTEGPDGPKVTSITLISEGNGQQGEGLLGDGEQLFTGPILSADGSTVAFDSTQALVPGAESGTENVYAENVATGAITLVSGGTGMEEVGVEQLPGMGTELVPEPDKAPGTGGDLDSDVTSVSADGKLIAYESSATDLGGAPVQVVGGDFVPSRGYVYNIATGATITIDGNALPQPNAAPLSNPYHNTYGPVLSGDGSKLFFGVHYVTNGEGQAQSLYEYNLATGVTTPVSLGNDEGSFQGNDIDATASKGGGLVLYQSAVTPQGTLDNPATGTMTTLLPGIGEVLTSAGNAYVYEEQSDGLSRLSNQLYETNLGVSVGIDPIAGTDAVGASVLAKAAAGSGLAVSGTTNAPRGALVQVQLFGASATTNTLSSPAVLGTVDGLGHWSATVPTALLQSADGNYALVVQIGTPTGNSFFSVRDFTVDTKAPDAPDAPKLDAGSDTSLASDGTATNNDTPILTGTAEAGATITLYDSLAATTPVVVGTATADADGVYAITPDTKLMDGKHALDVTATDAAGNVSAASADLSITVDTAAPTPPTLSLAPGNDTGTSDSDGITGNAGPTVSGTGEPGTQITLYDTDRVAMLGTATVKPDGTWQLDSSNLSDGVHTLTATDTDKAGNVSPASDPLAVTIDTLPPLQPKITSVTGQLVSGKITAFVTVNGTAEPGSKVQLVLDGGMGTDSIFGESTAASDGDYSINSDPLPAGDGQNLTVIAIDLAGNASQPSLPVDVDITDSATPPPGVPPFTPTLIGLLTDGPIAGATVFADSNGNGTRDANEGAAVTGTSGGFQLTDTGGELIATGGKDTTTGLSLPGGLTAPAHSTVIDPLTTLLDAYITQTSATQAAANAAVAEALGLLGGGATDLTMLDPGAAALSGSPALDPAVAHGAAAIADAKLADLAADFTATVGGLAGNTTSSSAIFADVFTALAAHIAALPGGGTLNLDDPTTLLSTIDETATLAGDLNPNQSTTMAAEQIVAAGNARLDTVAAESGQALLTGIAGVELVEQGAAATALGQIAASPTTNLPTTIVPQYTGAPLIAQASVTAALITGAPRLAPSSDQGQSDQDNITDDLAPTFVGTALPGTFVTLVEIVGTQGLIVGTQGLVLGSAQADTAGHYTITSPPLTATTHSNGSGTTLQIAAVGSSTDQHLTLGSTINLPTGTQPQTVTFEAPGLSDAAEIRNATPAASPANDAGHSALLLFLDTFSKGGFQVFADGGTTPIASGVILGQGADQGGPLTLTTTPLSLGAHTLTVTDTLPGGTVVTGSPSYQVTVTAPAVVGGTARAIGPIAGGTVTENDPNPPALGGNERDEVRSITGGNGGYTATIVSNPDKDLTLQDGYDTVTGLPIGGVLGGSSSDGTDSVSNPGGKLGPALTAPYNYTAISPLTTVVADLDFDDGNYYGASSAADTAENAAATLAAFGLKPQLDLATLDPLAEAQAGDPAPLLATIKLLDTVTIASVIIGYTFQPFADAIDDGSLDLDDATSVAAAISPFVTSTDAIYFSNQQVGEVAAIIAAGNAAIDAHAAAATSLADTLSYAFAAERLEQTAVLAAFSQVRQQDPGSPDILPGLVTSYTGTALDQAIEAERGHATQVVSLLPQGPASTGAPDVTFAITFSAPVTGLGPASFNLIAGAGLQGAAITGVSPVAGSNGETYDITVSTGVGNGTLALTYLGGGVEAATGAPITAGIIAPATTYLPLPGTTSTDLVTLATGDFNGDGRPDAVLLDYSDPSVTVYLNTGTGEFQAEASIATDTGYNGRTGAPVVADVNGDGKADIVIADSSNAGNASAVTVLLGNGNGSFQQPINTPLGFQAEEDVAADFNGDGEVDLAVGDASGTMHILLGDGAGGFTQISSFSVGSNAFVSTATSSSLIATGDFNGDGRTDLAIGSYTAGTVSIFLGQGDGTFTAGPVIATGTSTISLAVADLNHDGSQDIVVGNGVDGNDIFAVQNTLSVLQGNGDGTFKAPAPVTLNNGTTWTDPVSSVSIGDIDNDGNPDLVVHNNVEGNSNADLYSGVSVLLSNGDGTFRLGSQNFGGGTAPVSNLALADVNGDGRTDILSYGADLAPDVNSDDGLNVFLNEPETVIGSTSPTVTIARPAIATPALSETSGGGTFTHVGNAYTLDLGTLAQGSSAAAVLALLNTAAAPADSFDGSFSTSTGTGFALTGAVLAAAIAAGQSQGGITLTADTTTTGTHSETITFAPRDTTATAAETITLDDESGIVTPVSATAANPVAAELPAITLTITDNVVAGGFAAAALAPVPSIALPNVRVGGTDSEAITISNSAAAPAADLDVTATAAGDATVTGSVSGLAPQASDTTSVIAGLGTATAGQQTGTITLAPVSEPSTPLTAQNVTVSGSVYRPATAVITPLSAILHVGDPGLLSLGITNPDPADGFSENLRATLTNVSGPFSATAGESTGLVSAGTLSSALAVSFSTMAASVLTGTATIGLVSDGTGLDGLGTLALPSQTAPLSVTVDNYASAALQLLSGTGVLAASGTNYTLDLGTVAQGTALAEVLGVTNAASGPADLLSGHFALSGANAIGLTGFGDFAGLAAGQTDGGLDVSLDTSAAGTFTRTVTLTPTGSNASGYSGALTPETLTITATVAAATAASGSSSGSTPVATATQPGTSTPSLTTPVYRFFDTIHGTHLFTQSLSEAQNILSTRPDLMEETNNFGAVTPQTDPNAQAVYRFFEASNGTHFLTASYQEYLGLTTAGTATYRPDLTYEPSSTFYEHTTPQSGDVAVYRFFDTVQGTQYLTGSQSEYAGLTTAGSSTYRPDLRPEGIAFYAPAGSFST